MPLPDKTRATDARAGRSLVRQPWPPVGQRSLLWIEHGRRCTVLEPDNESEVKAPDRGQ